MKIITPQILLVDLKEDAAQTTAVALTAAELDVVTAVTYDNALQMFQQRVPDLMVLSIKQETAETTFAFGKAIQTRHNIPIVLIAEHYTPHLAIRALDDFAEDIVDLAIQPEILVARIRRILMRPE